MEKFRTLRADEIDCRIAQVKGNGLSLLLYKDARCDMNILDETVGEMNWQRSHSRDNANCTVSIWDESKKQWISKEDTGTESFTEKEKGLASDSFKRACFNWGIGRELYTAPYIWVSNGNCTIKEKADKRGYTCYDSFYVSNIAYDANRVINALQIKHKRTHKVVYELGKIENEEHQDNGVKQKKTDEDTEKLQKKFEPVFSELERIGYSAASLCKTYKVSNIKDMTDQQIEDFLTKVKSVPAKEVPPECPYEPTEPEEYGGLPFR